MTYDVRVLTVVSRPTVVAVGEVADLASLGDTILRLSREVYAALDAAGVDRRHRGCNVALHSGGDPLVVEVGIELVDPAGLADLSDSLSSDGGVRLSSLPAGNVATTLHQGPYHELPAAHAAIRAWCAAGGLELAGPNWEIYGDWSDDPAKLETEVFYLLS